MNHGSAKRWYTRALFIVPLTLAMLLAAGAATAFVLKSPAADPETPGAEAEAVAYEPFETEVPLASATDQIVGSMSLEEKVGQMMMIGFDGTSTSEEVSTAISDLHAGGLVLYSRNVASPQQIAELNTALQGLAKEAGQDYKLLIAIDQEGGKSRRIEQMGPYYSQPMIGEMHDTAPIVAQQQASTAARELKMIGVNTNLAPVVDVTAGWGTIMDGRSFSDNAEFVAEISAAAVKGYRNAVMICAPKHFPGHGFADTDSETSLPLVESDRETIEETDLVPFRTVIRERVPMILVGHLSVPALDPSETPASLSPIIINDLLRGSMGFQGVVITENLERGAITDDLSVAEAAVAAVDAGADIVTVSTTFEAQQQVHSAIVEAVNSGRLSQSEIDASVSRIIELKKKYRLEI